MRRKLHIPFYSNLSPKQRQRVNLVLGGLLALTAVMTVSGFIGEPNGDAGSARLKEPPRPKPLSAVPGQQLDPKDVWVGGAAKDVTKIREDVKEQEAKSRQRDELQDRKLAEILAKVDNLAGRGTDPRTAARGDAALQPGTNADASQPQESGAAASGATPVAQTNATPGNPTSLGGQPRTGRLPVARPSDAGRGAPTDYPPGQPNGGSAAYPAQAQAPAEPAKPASPGLIRVGAKASTTSEAATAPAGGATVRHVDNFLPVSYTRAILIGGVAAPTGGQAQSNPVPVLLRLADKAVLPNNYRSDVRDCLIIGEAHGDQSSERAYVRTTTLSCVMNDGTVLEVPIKGIFFGEDGMNGVAGTLVTKQGQILTNAALAGIASGIGSGLSQSTQMTAVSPLGSVSSTPNDTTSILKQGLGSGVGKALDRLSQYYISLAEKTFPVIEVQPGRKVDVVIHTGVSLDSVQPQLTGSGQGNGQKTSPRVGAAGGALSGAREVLRAAANQLEDE